VTSLLPSALHAGRRLDHFFGTTPSLKPLFLEKLGDSPKIAGCTPFESALVAKAARVRVDRRGEGILISDVSAFPGSLAVMEILVRKPARTGYNRKLPLDPQSHRPDAGSRPRCPPAALGQALEAQDEAKFPCRKVPGNGRRRWRCTSSDGHVKVRIAGGGFLVDGAGLENTLLSRGSAGPKDGFPEVMLVE